MPWRGASAASPALWRRAKPCRSMAEAAPATTPELSAPAPAANSPAPSPQELDELMLGPGAPGGCAGAQRKPLCLYAARLWPDVALAWVHRGRAGKALLGLLVTAGIGWGAYQVERGAPGAAARRTGARTNRTGAARTDRSSAARPGAARRAVAGRPGPTGALAWVLESTAYGKNSLTNIAVPGVSGSPVLDKEGHVVVVFPAAAPTRPPRVALFTRNSVIRRDHHRPIGFDFEMIYSVDMRAKMAQRR